MIVRSFAPIALTLWSAAQSSIPGSAVISGLLVTTEGLPVADMRVIALDTAYPRRSHGIGDGSTSRLTRPSLHSAQEPLSSLYW